jgi:acyl-CoA reductase-like NAD-dependent aldehyde dehydrogenase
VTAPARLRNFIAGEWRTSQSEEWIADLNPSNAEDVVAHVPMGTADDARAAVSSASTAHPLWRALSGPARAEFLHKWAATIGTRQDELAQMLAREVGKPIGEARGEVLRCVMILRYYAGEAVRSIGDVIPAQTTGSLQFTLRQPLGVVALITPWNFPAAIPLWKAAPALAFGNTIVLKPAESASQSAILLAECAAQAGLPQGVVNVVLGAGDVVGPALLDDPEVNAVSFTGSGRVGTSVAAAAARRNIRYQTEMGGKNVAIVMPDADLRQAATLTAAGAMRYAGQKCTATSRVIVAREIEGEFIDELRAQVASLSLGPVTDASSAIGPVISDRSRQSIRRVLDDMDAECIYAGEIPASAEFAHGFFVSPTVVRGAAVDSELAQRELFGPVLAEFVAEDLDHAIDLANSTPYGLSASLFTRDLRAALRYVDRIEAGMVRVNGDTTGVDPHAPFGGMKGSSSGSREQGPAAREFYTEIKTVQLNA